MASPERSRLLRPRFDLGVRNCAPRWAPLFSRDGLSDDIKRGGWLAANTLPLSILLASLAGAPASAGIFSAIVGSAMCVFLGGTRVALSGPGLASALVASSILTRYGVDGLGASLVLAGLLQLLTGALGVGRFVRFVPLPVLRGCVIGVGLTILLGQLPHALGAQVEPGAGPLAHFDAIALKLEDVVPEVASLCIGAALLGWLALKIRFVPGALLALVLVAVANSMLGLGLPTVHEAPSFPWPRAPLLPMSELAPLFGSALELWGTMTVATAINTVTLERLHADAGAEAKTDPDQELIGNGLATLVLGFLQGLPATQLVARSNLGVRQKVASPRPALIQALFLLVFGLAAWPLLPFVPVAALTGVAVVVAIPLLTIRPLWALGRVSGLDLWLALATIVTMLVTGTVTGLLLGIAVAFAVVAIKMARTRALLHRSSDPSGPHQVNFSGPITFLASLELERLRAVLAHLDPRPGLVLDLRNVVAVDGTGASALVELLDLWRGRGGQVALLGPSLTVRERLLRTDENRRRLPEGVSPGALKQAVAVSDRELDAVLGKPIVRMARPQLLAGITRFRQEMRGHYDALFSHLADGQSPHTMFITCADSRIEPALLTGAHPGDLFTVRAIGALVAPSGSAVWPQEGAAVEYGVGVLGVRTIIVCGHSRCGAISALKTAKVPPELETLGVWAKHAAELAGDVAPFETPDEAARAVTVRQIHNLLSYPLVREKHERGELQIHAWFYDLGQVELFEWDAQRETFVELTSEDPSLPSHPPPPVEAVG